MNTTRFVSYTDRFEPHLPAEQAAEEFCKCMQKRRSVRSFSERAVSRRTIEWIIRAACSAPSGANKQPWRFVCVNDSKLKLEIRIGAEQEEQAFYRGRAGQQWLDDLARLGTDADKSFLETAPWLIVVFKLAQVPGGTPTYYASESVGIAVGMLLSAAHHAGLATLIHTPSPMRFLGRILKRPANERPYLLIPVGYPTDDCQVPLAAMERKPLHEVMLVRD